ncbi:MAG: hypothetical protein A2W90_19610 [Bacteroidetes bacterium GWF2_42_66]|nr:MAG: hypothetical protein A2W92_17870 [Bacteroidetes bacterium GWA2_42_15]OFX98632.1 MAG: hypothetical protein A2W89_10085 [Bacteroidetes bacterium GWE2_42_39]OFY43171.1 MAG: hypothetical protein A2W90_19610 [Bacteroidetes bacterium GWF2_42_66]HBL76976.1 hypothetical protein [Prolixibacteraceae bacterium]HCR89622.1 hypothetical protein [Prolixibacteraceae bacterium]
MFADTLRGLSENFRSLPTVSGDFVKISEVSRRVDCRSTQKPDIYDLSGLDDFNYLASFFSTNST